MTCQHGMQPHICGYCGQNSPHQQQQLQQIIQVPQSTLDLATIESKLDTIAELLRRLLEK